VGLGSYLKEDKFELTRKQGTRVKKIPNDFRLPHQPPFRQPLLFSTGDQSLPRALVFHDSFSIELQPLLAEHFEEILFVWDYQFNLETIDKFKPDVVMTIVVERISTLGDLKNPPEVDAVLKSNPPVVKPTQ